MDIMNYFGYAIIYSLYMMLLVMILIMLKTLTLFLLRFKFPDKYIHICLFKSIYTKIDKDNCTEEITDEDGHVITYNTNKTIHKYNIVARTLLVHEIKKIDKEFMRKF